MADLRCPSCSNACDLSDNFCRHCGQKIAVNLPALRSARLPAEVRSIPPSLVGSVAVLALGTGLEWAARRLGAGALRGAARATGRALLNKGLQSQTRTAAEPDPAFRVDELLYIRRTRFER